MLSLLTGGYLAFVAWLTLTPQVDAAGHISVAYRVLDALHRRGYLLSIDDTELEFLANIALFVPVGMFLLLLFGTRLWWVALAASFAMTTFIEIAQRSIPGRVGVLIALVLTLPATLRRRRKRRATATATTATVRVPVG